LGPLHIYATLEACEFGFVAQLILFILSQLDKALEIFLDSIKPYLYKR